MGIPKSCELLVIQDFVEYLMTWIFWKNIFDMKKKFWKNIFLRLCFQPYLLFVLKKNFEAKRILERNKIKEGKPTWFRRPNSVERGLLKILFLLSFLFLFKHGFCSILFKKRKYIVLNWCNRKKGGFQCWENLWAFKEKKT